MDKEQIKQFILEMETKRDRTITIIDYGNVEKWKNSLGWDVGIRELSQLIKHFSFGKEFLRRFYYGADYGKNEKSTALIGWSKKVLETARNNRLNVISKRVKYIHDNNNTYGFAKKCDLDVEMSIDLVKERDSYDIIVLFSGDGDLMYATRYLKDTYGKECYVFGARGHIGREVQDALKEGYVNNILFVEDFEYRLNSKRWN